ncbi:MAG: NADPH-dependent F420 reductase [Gemmatimonadota bacterium]
MIDSISSQPLPSFSPPGRRLGGVAALVLLLIMAMAATLPAAPLSAQEPVAIQEDRVLTIGIIGAGSMGGPIGQLWADAGHKIVWSSRNPSELVDLVESARPRASAGFADASAHFGDVVLLAVPSGAIPQIGRDFAHLMEGKVVIDVGNPRADRDGEIAEEWLEMGTGLATAQYLPGARVVKAFNTLAAGMLEEAHRPGELIGVPVAGDDEEARQIAATLVRDAGLEPVIVGDLESAERFDRGTDVWVTGMTADEIRETMELDQP